MKTSLHALYAQLAEVFTAPREIDQCAKEALLKASEGVLPILDNVASPLPQAYWDIMAADNAHPVCDLIKRLPLIWEPPKTSNDPLYVAHSQNKAHVELIGPEGLVRRDDIRIGLYGILPHTEYGIRSHVAEEVFKMLAGECFWIRGDMPYTLHHAGEESYHPSMMPHATKTADKAFMSIYVWHGDVSFESYSYQGILSE